MFLALAAIVALVIGALDTKNRQQGRVKRRLQEVSIAGAPRVAQAQHDAETALGYESDSAQGRLVRRQGGREPRHERPGAADSTRRTSPFGPGSGRWFTCSSSSWRGCCHAAVRIQHPHHTRGRRRWGSCLPWAYLGYRAQKRRAEFYAVASRLPADAGRQPVGRVLAAPGPGQRRQGSRAGTMGMEINRALLESRLGLPIEESLEAVAQRMESQDFHWTVMAIRINRQVGGNLAEVLTNVAKTVRERERLRRQVQGPLCGGRAVGVDPRAAARRRGPVRRLDATRSTSSPLFTTALRLGDAGDRRLVLYFAGIIWMRNLVNMEV